MLTIDTNILILYFNNDEKIVRQLLNWREANTRFFISVITEIEVLSFPKLTSKEIDKIQRFLREFTIIPIDSQMGRIAAEIRRQYRLNLGDSIIVATAQLTNSSLVTQDKDIIKKAKNLIRIQS